MSNVSLSSVCLSRVCYSTLNYLSGIVFQVPYQALQISFWFPTVCKVAWKRKRSSAPKKDIKINDNKYQCNGNINDLIWEKIYVINVIFSTWVNRETFTRTPSKKLSKRAENGIGLVFIWRTKVNSGLNLMQA